ncbi:MAG: type IV toxin-antitoxin system AbiEi family antitoxin domain-containing protein [Dermatophilaceae bacterium]
MIDVPAALNSLPPVFDLRQAAAVGLSGRVVQRAVRGHLVRRLGRGVFVAVAVWRESSPRDRHLLTTAAAARRRPWAVVSHHSAACLFGLPLPLDMPQWVALSTDRSAATALPRGVARLEPGQLPAHHVEEHNGLPITSPARTVIDCLRELPLPDAVAIADAALRRGLINVADLDAVRQEQRGWPFITNADTGLRLLDPSRETWFESWSFIRLWQLGVELPESQVSVHDHRGRFLGRVDGIWRDDATVAEADGRGKYLGQFDPDGASAEAAARAVVAEKVREDRMRDCGLEFVRWDLTMMLGDAAGVADQVANTRRRGDISRFTGRLMPPPSPLVAAKPLIPLCRAS